MCLHPIDGQRSDHSSESNFAALVGQESDHPSWTDDDELIVQRMMIILVLYIVHDDGNEDDEGIIRIL